MNALKPGGDMSEEEKRRKRRAEIAASINKLKAEAELGVKITPSGQRISGAQSEAKYATVRQLQEEYDRLNY